MRRARIVAGLALLTLVSVSLFSPTASWASSSSTFNQSITGTLGVDIVDASDVTVGSPSVAFTSKSFAATTQTSTGTLGVSAQKIRVTNPTTTATWAMSIAATSGNTTLWSAGTPTMDFNGAASAGRLTVDPSVGTLVGVGTTATTNITKGSSTAFAQGTTDSITLLTAGASAQAPGQWDFTGVSMTQDIPALQATGSYSISMTLTVS